MFIGLLKSLFSHKLLKLAKSFRLTNVKEKNIVLTIKNNKNTLKDRILKRYSEENREDDNIEVIETRYKEYLNSTQKVSDSYKDKLPTIFHEIDGSLQISEITEKIKQILK